MVAGEDSGEILTPTRLADLHPTLYHMAEDGSWPSIQSRGLLSTSAILDSYGITGRQRVEIECCRRSRSVILENSVLGRMVIRDNLPMSDAALLNCLQGCSPRDWYKTLNRRVFFWVSRDRLLRLLNARAYRKKAHIVLSVDTKRLLNVHADAVTLAPINTGATVFRPQPRGRDTFARIGEYDFEGWYKKRRGREPIVELAVDYAISDIADHVVQVERFQGGKATETLYGLGSRPL